MESSELPDANASGLPVGETFREGKALVLVNGAILDTSRCILTGRTAKFQKSIRLRNPFNPITWILGYDKIDIGLSRKKFEDYRLKRALSWSLIFVGILMTIIGCMSGILTILIGACVTVVGLFLRSMFPIWCSSKTSNSVSLRGCGEEYTQVYHRR